jgi:hypothetical protein
MFITDSTLPFNHRKNKNRPNGRSFLTTFGQLGDWALFHLEDGQFFDARGGFDAHLVASFVAHEGLAYR